MCDDSKWLPKDKPSSVESMGPQKAKGKPSGIRPKICPQLDRTKWCEKLPRGHDEAACHLVSQKRREVLQEMRKLVDAHVNKPVCPEWDTSETCENTPGPYRFGVAKMTAEDFKIVASKMQKGGCDCLKRNGLQDDCRMPRCHGSPACKITPFPKCGPFTGTPPDKNEFLSNEDYRFAWGGDHCKCPEALCK